MRFVLDHSSPVHPVSESRGGRMSVTDGGDGNWKEETEILVSNIGLTVLFKVIKVSYPLKSLIFKFVYPVLLPVA